MVDPPKNAILGILSFIPLIRSLVSGAPILFLIIPQESAYSCLINIPEKFTLNQAYEYIGDPNTGLQIPVAINQADYFLSKTSLPQKKLSGKICSQYQLTCIPKKSIDNVISTIQILDLELHAIDFANICQLRLISQEISLLKEHEYTIYKTGLLKDNYIWKNLHKIDIPCLIIRASDSNAFLENAANKVSKLNKKIAIKTLNDTSHLFPLEKPSTVSELINKFLEDII